MSINSGLGTVLVTGGCGFIGTNLVKYLSKKGYKVKILDNLTTASHKFVSQESRVTSSPPQPSTQNSELGTLDLVVRDIRDRKVVEGAIKGAGAVVHFAAHTSVVESLENPQEGWEINVNGTLNLLEACRQSGVKKFIFASSNAVVGEQDPPIDETRLPQPLSPYGASKLAGEALCSAYYHSFGLKTISLRFANVYGPYSDHKPSVISIFMKQAKQGKPLVIYGDGNQTRDFIHVEDICQAIYLSLMTLDSGLSTSDSRLFQIGSGVETSINELAEMIKQIASNSGLKTFNSELLSCDPGPKTEGSRLKTIYEPERKGEIRRNYSDISKARAVLGFEPRIKLEQGLQDLWEWYETSARGGSRKA